MRVTRPGLQLVTGATRPHGSQIHEFESTASLSACQWLTELCCSDRTTAEDEQQQHVDLQEVFTAAHWSNTPFWQENTFDSNNLSVESTSFLWLISGNVLPRWEQRALCASTGIWTLWPNHLLVLTLPSSHLLTGPRCRFTNRVRWHTERNILDYIRTSVTAWSSSAEPGSVPGLSKKHHHCSLFSVLEEMNLNLQLVQNKLASEAAELPELSELHHLLFFF